MGNSTVSLQSVIDHVVTQGVHSPLSHPAGYGSQLAIDIGNDVMSDLISERFNWKWNRHLADAIWTNSWQQDYPTPGLNNDIGWLENADRIDINNTSNPKPLKQITARKDLPATSYCRGPITDVCWLYNSELKLGAWPGPNVTYYPRITGSNPVQQNPLMGIFFENTILTVWTFGTTGSAPPALPPTVPLGSPVPEGTVVPDGTMSWIVCAPTSKGYRVYPLPGATGPVWEIIPRYQSLPPTFSDLQQMLDPIPDDQAKHFRKGYRAYCLDSSPDPKDRQRFQPDYQQWILSLLEIKKSADKELNVYGLVPASYPVDEIYPGWRDPRDPSQPY
jgi:hypothetical protein